MERRALARQLDDVKARGRLDERGVDVPDLRDRERGLGDGGGHDGLVVAAVGGAREEAQIAEAVLRLGVLVVALRGLAPEGDVGALGEHLREHALGCGAIADDDVARPELLRLVELVVMRLEVGLDVRVGDVRELDVILELGLHHGLDHHLLARALDLVAAVVALRVGVGGEQLEADHVVEELPAALRAAVARAQVRGLLRQALGELADGDRLGADLHERLGLLLLRQPVHALAARRRARIVMCAAAGAARGHAADEQQRSERGPERDERERARGRGPGGASEGGSRRGSEGHRRRAC